MSRYVLIARHGARQDAEDKNWKPRARYPHDSPLSAIGHMQAKQLAEHIKQSGIVIDSIFSSPLLRAAETAVYSARALDCKVVIDSGLHEWFDPRAYSSTPEMNHWVWNLSSLFPEIMNESRWTATKMGKGCVELENEMQLRCSRAIQDILYQYPSNLLIFTHGSPAREMISCLRGKRSSFPTEAGVTCLKLDHDEKPAERVWTWKPEDIVSGDGR